MNFHGREGADCLKVLGLSESASSAVFPRISSVARLATALAVHTRRIESLPYSIDLPSFCSLNLSTMREFATTALPTLPHGSPHSRSPRFWVFFCQQLADLLLKISAHFVIRAGFARQFRSNYWAQASMHAQGTGRREEAVALKIGAAGIERCARPPR